MIIDRETLRDGLRELASETLQEALWIRGVEGERHSYEEAVCYVFDDSSVAIALEKGALPAEFSDEIREALEQLRKTIHSIPGHEISEKEIIEHPKMEEVRALANRILEGLGPTLSS